MEKRIGLDIGVDFIHLVEIGIKKNGFSVLRAESFETPAGIMDDGYIKDHQLLAGVINGHLKNGKKTRLSVSLNSSNEVIRDFSMPKMPLAELEAALELDISQSYRGIYEDHTMSYKIIDETDGYRGYIAFCTNEILDTYGMLGESLECKLDKVDIHANACLKVMNNRLGIKGVFILVDVGRDITRINLYDNEIIRLSRTLDFGYGSLLGTARSRLDREVEAEEFSELDMSDALSVMRVGLYDLEAELQRLISYYKKSINPLEIERIYLGGELLSREAFIKTLSDGLDTRLEPVSFHEKLAGKDTDLTRFIPAIGSALAGV